MNSSQFVKFIKTGEVSDINKLISYCIKENLFDIFNFYSEKYKISIPPKYKYLFDLIKRKSKNRFDHIVPYISELNKNYLHCFVIKGPVTSKYIYGDYYTRLYEDIDLIVPTNEYSLMHQILENKNFKNAFITDNNNDKHSYDFAYKIKGEDIVYSKLENDIEIGFEVRDSIRELNNNQLCLIFKNLEESKYNEFSFYHPNLDYTIILQIVYSYMAYFTEYGILNKYKIKYLIELYMLVSTHQYDLKKIYELCKEIHIEDMYFKVIDYYNLIFNNKNDINNSKLKYILNSFDNNLSIVNDFYISLFDSLKNLRINEGFDLKTFNNYGRFKIEIYRNFTKKNIKKKIYLEYDIFNDEKNIIFFVSFPRYLSDVTMQISIVNSINYQYETEFTYYRDGIYEFRTAIMFNYIFNYYDHQKKCLIFKIDKDIFYKYVSNEEFIIKIVLRKILNNKYPTLTNENISYNKFKFKKRKR